MYHVSTLGCHPRPLGSETIMTGLEGCEDFGGFETLIRRTVREAERSDNRAEQMRCAILCSTPGQLRADMCGGSTKDR